jgi:hypothetical protein
MKMAPTATNAPKTIFFIPTLPLLKTFLFSKEIPAQWRE